MYRSVVLVMVTALVPGCWGADVPVMPDAGGTVDPTGDGGPEARPCTLGSMSQTVATLAGCNQKGTSDGPRGEARFDNPTNVVIAESGVAYVTDFDSSRVRAIDASGTTTTIYQAANFKHPFGIALGPNGTLYVETDDNDMGVHSIDSGTIWRVDPIAKTATVIARDLGRPRGLAVLDDGRIAFADHMHHDITILDPATGLVAPLAGQRDLPGYANGVGAAVQFSQPYDLVKMPDGALIVADMDNHRLRRVQLDGTVENYAGSGDAGTLSGPCAVATFDAPQALAVLPDGTLFVSDPKRKLIRRVAAGMVTTIAGDGTPGWLDAEEPRNSRFYGVEGMDVHGTRLVIADGNIGDGAAFHHVRVVQLSQLP